MDAIAQTDFADELVKLKAKVDATKLPEDLKDKAIEMLGRLNRMINTGVYSAEYDRISHYIDWITSIPWGETTTDKLDIVAAATNMNKSHYGMQETKDRILEYLATIKLRMDQGGEKVVRAPAIFLVGLVGTGKTTFAYSLAETLGRKFARIPFGGLGSAQDLRGKSRLFAEAEPGHIVKALRDAGSMNPIILLDEIDRVGAEERADIMGVLVELLDPTQNNRFLDHYLDFPLDLSQVLFVATANNTTNVATAVLDRLELIQMPSYTDEEKIHISREYLLPKALKESGLLPSQLVIDESVWPVVARPLGYDAGIRTLQRTLAALTRRVAREIVEGKTATVKVDISNYKQYMKAY
ncbi:AAA family ATPase [Candidatus Woesebacteria bacterium]|nr:AAA family ATPase [Candidatus Woesebacteria bacterium]